MDHSKPEDPDRIRRRLEEASRSLPLMQQALDALSRASRWPYHGAPSRVPPQPPPAVRRGRGRPGKRLQPRVLLGRIWADVLEKPERARWVATNRGSTLYKSLTLWLDISQASMFRVLGEIGIGVKEIRSGNVPRPFEWRRHRAGS